MTDYREHDPDLLNPDELPTFKTRSVQASGGLGPGSVHDHLVKARRAGWSDAMAAVQPMLHRKDAQIAAQAKAIHELSERIEDLVAPEPPAPAVTVFRTHDGIAWDLALTPEQLTGRE